MKVLAILLAISTSLNVYGQEYYIITAQSGLNVRLNSSLSSKKVAKIPFGVMVEKISNTDKTLTINDNGKQVTGRFVKIKYNNYLYLVSEETEPFEREGFVFDAYLKEVKNVQNVSRTQITKTAYSELLKKAPPKPLKAKMVGDLDSIKTILKNRVEWVTEFENEDYQRDDAIKSITISNGQKLLINQTNNDYGFSEGWSGYYPEYDILALEGGHASDMCFSIKTGETDFTIGNPEYIVPSPKNNFRLNGYFGGQECVTYFFQKKENGRFVFLSQFNWDYDVCTFREFYWISETSFIYKTLNYTTDSVNGTGEYFIGEIKTTHKY